MKTIQQIYLELRMRSSELEGGESYTGPYQIAGFCSDLEKEPFRVLRAFYLDIERRFIGFAEVARGSSSYCDVQPWQVFTPALLANAVYVITVGNFPTIVLGLPRSQEEKIIKRIRAAGMILGIRLFDHIVITDGAPYSFAWNSDQFSWWDKKDKHFE